MCVILVCDETRPSPEAVAESWRANSHGGGVAWLDQTGPRPLVRWRKALKLDEMSIYCADLPLPFIAHFRVASVGGHSLELTHPFPVTPTAELDLEGATEGAVLFHNGTWREWREPLWTLGIQRQGLPWGPWSDSRAMAVLAAEIGESALELVEGWQRICTFSPQPDVQFGLPYTLNLYGDWPNREDDGLLASNGSWKPRASEAGWRQNGQAYVWTPPGAGGPAAAAPFPGHQAATTSPEAHTEAVIETPKAVSALLPGRLESKGARKLRRRAEKAAAAEERRLQEALRKGTPPTAAVN
jgi:hypothetical protein